MENISIDELIINFVRDNACLYDKKDTNYKNSKKKKELWQSIAEYFRNVYNIDMSADAVEKRWLSLRDMFTRENRKQKLPPSGSGYELRKEWALYKTMMFLAPHIAHRQTKTSLPHLQNTIQSESEIHNFLIDEQNTYDILDSCINHDYDKERKILKDITPNENNNNMPNNNNNMANENQTFTTTIDRDLCNRPSSSLSSSSSSNLLCPSIPSMSSSLRFQDSTFKHTKNVIPPLDSFAERRKLNDQLIDQQIAEASSTISAAVKSITSTFSTQEKKSGYMLVIEEGLKRIPDKQITKCIIEALQVIEKYEEI